MWSIFSRNFTPAAFLSRSRGHVQTAQPLRDMKSQIQKKKKKKKKAYDVRFNNHWIFLFQDCCISSGSHRAPNTMLTPLQTTFLISFPVFFSSQAPKDMRGMFCVLTLLFALALAGKGNPYINDPDVQDKLLSTAKRLTAKGSLSNWANRGEEKAKLVLGWFFFVSFRFVFFLLPAHLVLKYAGLLVNGRVCNLERSRTR
jgi:hypothetical protein